MGWMPIPIDAAAWQSIWTLERIKQTGYKPKLGEVQFDFNLGYIGTATIALCFLTLGAFLMFGSGQEYATSAAAFSNQFIELYTTAMRSEEHTSELQSRGHLVCPLLLEKKK